MAIEPGDNIDEIRFENDMIKFIFTFSPGMQEYYHKNMARQYFSFFFSPEIIFLFF